MRNPYYTIKWIKGGVSILDQRLIPHKEIYRYYKDYRKVVEAIKTMVIRGAPAIGVAAAFGIALGFSRIKGNDKNHKKAFFKIIGDFKKSRPTAVNLFWAIGRMTKTFSEYSNEPIKTIQSQLIKEALDIYEEDIETNRRICENGEKLLRNGYTVLTHCNAGPLATAGYGTAQGIIITASKKGRDIKVFVDETRPRLQGARLTAWEMLKNNVDVTLISDNMAGYFMGKGMVDIIITGADRIALNGDSANKIGTYSVAVSANYHKIPFYIAAPISTIDFKCKNGEKIPIEERNQEEVIRIGKELITAKGVKTRNPAFDVTPAKLIKGIITEKGILKPPYTKSIKRLFQKLQKASHLSMMGRP